MNPEIASFEEHVRKLQRERGLSWREAWDTAQREQPFLYAAMAKDDQPLTPHLGMRHEFNLAAPTGLNGTANAAAHAFMAKVRNLAGGNLSYGEAWDLCMNNPENAELVREMRS